MIHIVNAQNRHLYSRELWEMFLARKRHYIDERGWTELWNFDGAEIDDSDDERAVYLIALGPKEELWGFVRVRPTDDHSILVDKYPHLVDSGQPQLKGPEAWEGSRIVVTDAAPNHAVTFATVHLASCEVIVHAGARRITAFVDVHNFPVLTDGAAELAMTGAPAPYRHGTMVGIRSELSPEVLERMRASLGEPMRVSYEVTDEDLKFYGSLARVQHAVDCARRVDAGEAKVDLATPVKTKARIMAHYARGAAIFGAAPAPSLQPLSDEELSPSFQTGAHSPEDGPPEGGGPTA